MLTNATILRIDRQTGHGADGKPVHATGDATFARCAVDAVSQRQRHTLGAVIQDADMVCYAAIDPATQSGDMLLIRIDGRAQASLCQVITITDRVAPANATGGGNSHLEIFLRKEPIGS